MMPGNEKQKVFRLRQVTLTEGKMWGRELKDINRWVDETGRLLIKFIIYYVRLQVVMARIKFHARAVAIETQKKHYEHKHNFTEICEKAKLLQ